jgi:hypothetical protein
MLNGFILDCESDGFFFQGTKLWCIHFEDLDTETVFSFNPFQMDKATGKKLFLEWLDRYDNPIVGFHYGLGYDMFAIMRHLGIEFTVGPDTIEGRPVRFIDTLYWSMYLNPDRVGHSIEAFGERLGLHKIDWRLRAIELGLIPPDTPEGTGIEFKQWHPELGVYCARDVAVNKKVFMFLLGEHQGYYTWTDVMPDSFKCGQKSFFLMSCQEFAGWKFDIPKAEALIPRIGIMMEELRAEVEPQLPPRALKKGEEKFYSMPKNPYKKDGTYSSHMINFIAKHNGKEIEHGKVEFYGKEYSVASELLLDVKLPMEMANQDQLKDWLLELGWEPTFWNFKRGPDGKPERDPKTRQLTQTSPKIQEAQKICPNLEAMDMPIIKLVVKWLSLRNRQSVLTGWLNNERLKMDGRIGGGRTGIAATHRQKHQVLVNVPKASEKVLLGKEFRELFTSEEGFWIAAGDAAALEGRVQGHYTWKYDNGETAREILDGDPHSKTAKSVYAEELKDIDINAEDFSKDDPFFKPFRDRSKNVFYAGLYGAGDAKLAKVAGLPESQGKIISEKFWAANPATKKLKDALEAYWNGTGKKKFLPGIDGRYLMTRKKSALLNTIFQSCGGIVMDYAGCFMDSWLGKIYWDEMWRPYYLYKGKIVRRIGYFHDEYEYECEGEDTAHEVGKLIEKAIEKAGKHLKIKVPLKGEAKCGKNWSQTH